MYIRKRCPCQILGVAYARRCVDVKSLGNGLTRHVSRALPVGFVIAGAQGRGARARDLCCARRCPRAGEVLSSTRVGDRADAVVEGLRGDSRYRICECVHTCGRCMWMKGSTQYIGSIDAHNSAVISTKLDNHHLTSDLRTCQELYKTCNLLQKQNIGGHRHGPSLCGAAPDFAIQRSLSHGDVDGWRVRVVCWKVVGRTPPPVRTVHTCIHLHMRHPSGVRPIAFHTAHVGEGSPSRHV